MRKVLACTCGDKRFEARIAADEQVGLVTCGKRGHHALLLDSRDHWHTVIQAGRPRAAKCKCGSTAFGVELEYRFRGRTRVVREIDVDLRCATCAQVKRATTVEIDYEPTKALIAKPLDPCETPWLKAKQTELSALWKPDDLVAVIRHLTDELGARCYFAGWNERAKRATAKAAIAGVRAHDVYDLVFAARDVELPERLRDCWQQLPVIHVRNPFAMNYSTGAADLYMVQYANQVFEAGRVVAQERGLLDLAGQLTPWLATRFVSQRGKQCFDNPAEYARLKGAFG